MTPADRATVLSIATILRQAVLRQARDDADRIADRVVARITGGVEAATGTVDTSAGTSEASSGGSPNVTTPQIYFTLAEAAVRLGTTKGALKKYLARHQRREGRDTV